MTVTIKRAWSRVADALRPPRQTCLSAGLVNTATFGIMILYSSPAPALDLPTYAYDGDDIMLGGQDYRLEAVDAFEDGQTCRAADGAAYNCGAEGKMSLQAILGGQDVICAWTGKKDRRGRLIANCKAGNFDIEAELVRTGWAHVRPDFIRRKPGRISELCAIEAEARAAKRGMWAGDFKLPYHHKGGRKPREKVTCPLSE